MRIIIVGAGLGGLTAALCFARNGHKVQVLEQRPDLTPAGGGINIRPDATRLLQSWGLTEDLDQICDVTSANALRSLKSGKIATRTIAVDVSDAKDLGTNRDILLSLLHKKALEAGATLLFNTAVAQVTETSEEAQVSLRNGTTLQADLILATDGVRSSIRKQVLQGCPGPIEPDISDMTVYGIRLTRDQMISEPALAPLMDNTYINVYMGDNGIVHVTSRYVHKLGMYQALFCIKGDTDQKGLWDEEGDIEYVRGFFQDSCKEIVRVLEMAGSCDRWKLAELPNLPRWASEQGRILLVGDSAHAMHPTAAQGYSLIVEDIGVLDYLLSTTQNANANMKTISEDWQNLRKTRCERIKAWAKNNTEIFSRPPPEVKTSDSGAWQYRSLKDTKPDMNARFGSAAFLKWAQGIDSIEEAKKYLRAKQSRL